MVRFWVSAWILLTMGLTGCQLTREPKPPKAPEEFRKPPDEARFQTPNFYPNSVLNQDNQIRIRDDSSSTPSLLNSRSMRNGGAGGSMGR